MKLTFQYDPNCFHFREFIYLVELVARELQIPIDIFHQQVSQEVNQDAEIFFGSPSLLVEGRDLEDRKHPADGAQCRKYGERDIPPRWLIETAFSRALKPKHVLFLCVNNSARSQLAEAIARQYAPPGITVTSAGSSPTEVRPLALQVLQEAGFSTHNLYSKAVTDLDTTTVDNVITLCAEEVCPYFLGEAKRLHWGLADPAAVQGDKHSRLQAFRETRDELSHRLSLFFCLLDPLAPFTCFV